MQVVQAKGKVILDNTGKHYEIPLLLSEDGPLTSLMDFLLAHYHDRSPSWMQYQTRAAKLMLNYLEANQECFEDPIALFQNFAQRLHTGTIGDDGLDPSGLYWLPRSRKAANRLVGMLTSFTDWLAEKHARAPMNPLRKADHHEQRLNYAAWHRRNAHDFLGHIKDTRIAVTAMQSRHFRSPPTQRIDNSAIAFPETDFQPLWDALSKDRYHRQIEIRDKLMLLLIHGAGLRLSEVFHLFVQDVDVDEDPHVPGCARVRIYHPDEGRAPDGWKGRKGEQHRAAYLQSVYGLSSRKRLTSKQQAGWKGTIVDGPEMYIHVQWFPRAYGALFLRLWREYLFFRSQVSNHHPYAFVSFIGNTHGQPYTMMSFYDMYKRAIRRAGLAPGRINAHSPHCHRHAYGRRLVAGGVSGRMIQKCMHHSSEESQSAYTSPTVSEVHQALKEADERLSSSANLPTLR